MNIIVIYEHLAREWRAAERLSQILSARGHAVRRFSNSFERTKAYLYAKRNPVDVLITPWLAHVDQERLLSPILDANPNVTVLNLHHEQISNEAFKEALYPQTPFARNGAFHCAWGTFFRDALLAHGVQENRIFITGNIRNDEAFSHTVSRERLATEFGLDSRKAWVLFAENRGWILQWSKDAASKFLEGQDVNKADVDDIIRYTKESMNAFFEELRGLDTAFGEKFEFIYRPHPGTHFECPADFPDCVHIIKAHTIYDWIQQCDLFLTCESTSIFEADMCGKPVALFDLVAEPEYLKTEGVHSYPRLDSLRHISADYIESLRGKDRERPYLRYLGEADGCAAQRVADAVEAAVKIRLPSYPYSRASNKQLLRQFVWETATFCMEKTGLLNIMKYPHSAYLSQGDIPYSKKNQWIMR